MNKKEELIKNIKVYDRINREKNLSQRKKSRFKIRLASLALTVTLLLSGCGKYSESQQRIYDETHSSSSIQNSQIDGIKNDSEIEFELESNDSNGLEEIASTDLKYYEYILNQSVSFTNLNNVAIQNISNSVNVEYPFSDISNIKTSYNRYQIVPAHQTYETNSKIIEGRLTPQELFSIVIENNEKYKNENKYTMHGTLDDDYILSICEVICDTLKNELPKLNYSDNLDDLSYNILDLCIFKTPTTANAQITDDNCLIVSETQIANYAALNGVDEQVTFKKTITHEIEHLIQKLSTQSKNDLNIERGYGFMYAFEDIEVNSMYWNWFIESSAEKLAASFYDIKPMSYTYMINYLNTLILVNSFDDNIKVDDVPRLTQQSNINEIFRLFGCSTEESKIELLNMMYAIEIIQIEPKDFFVKYNNQLGREATDEEIIEIKIELKNSLCQTYTKYFYNNLSEKLTNSSILVSDIYKLIALYEADLNYHISYANQDRFAQIEVFMENYVSIQNEFFEQLSKQLGISIEEVRNSYEIYNTTITTPKKSILKGTTTPGTDMSISIFSEEKNEFLNTVFTNIGVDKTNTIFENYQEYSNKYQKN